MERELTKFWRDVADAYAQVNLHPERSVTIQSDADGLTAAVAHDTVRDVTMIGIKVGSTKTTPDVVIKREDTHG